eukprot:Awhi_evm1s4096
MAKFKACILVLFSALFGHCPASNNVTVGLTCGLLNALAGSLNGLTTYKFILMKILKEKTMMLLKWLVKGMYRVVPYLVPYLGTARYPTRQYDKI